MEDFAWILIFLVVWLFSSVGKARKSGQKRRRPGGALPDQGERTVRAGPAAGRRDLSADLAEGARRAEEALRRWEARQRAATREPATSHQRELAETAVPREADRTTERRGRSRRAVQAAQWSTDRDRFHPMRSDPGVAPSPGLVPGLSPRPAVPLPLLSGPVTPPEPSAAGPEPRRIVRGRGRMERLTTLQQAILWRDLLGPPVGLRPPGE